NRGSRDATRSNRVRVRAGVRDGGTNVTVRRRHFVSDDGPTIVKKKRFRGRFVSNEPERRVTLIKKRRHGLGAGASVNSRTSVTTGERGSSSASIRSTSRQQGGSNRTTARGSVSTGSSNQNRTTTGQGQGQGQSQKSQSGSRRSGGSSGSSSGNMSGGGSSGS